MPFEQLGEAAKPFSNVKLISRMTNIESLLICLSRGDKKWRSEGCTVNESLSGLISLVRRLEIQVRESIPHLLVESV
jgi:hypothetical protein